MARIRTIKPEFPQSQSMGRVSRDARLTFVLLWTLADDSGRLRGNSRMLASLLFPYDDDAPKLLPKWMAELEREKSIVRYQVDSCDYVQICNWLAHQKIDKPSASKLPPFANPLECSANPRECSSEEGKGREGKGVDQGREGKGREAPPLPAPVLASEQSTATIAERDAMSAMVVKPLPLNGLQNGKALSAVERLDRPTISDWWRRQIGTESRLTGATALDLLHVLCCAVECSRRRDNKIGAFGGKMKSGEWVQSTTNIGDEYQWLSEQINTGRIEVERTGATT